MLYGHRICGNADRYGWTSGQALASSIIIIIVTDLDCLLGLYWTGLNLFNCFHFQLFFIFIFCVVQ